MYSQVFYCVKLLRYNKTFFNSFICVEFHTLHNTDLLENTYEPIIYFHYQIFMRIAIPWYSITIYMLIENTVFIS